MSDIEYSNLLFDISEKLDVNKLPRLLFMCRKEIAEGSEENIRDVLSLFKELEKQNRLGTDRLDTLKEILTHMKKRSLLKKVEEFEIRRKAQSVGIVSSLKRAATCIKGAIKLVCNLRTIAGGVLVVSSGMALRKCSSLDEFVEVFNKVVLVSYSKLVEISEGSLCFTVQAETSSALRELWDLYKSGTLQNRLQEFLVTDEIKQLAGGEDVEVTVYIDEQEYKAAYLDLMLLQNQAPDVEDEKRLGGRRRRNSDSFLCFKPHEEDVTLMKLKHAENRWNFERQTLEEENDKLKTEIAEVGTLQRRLFCREEDSAQDAEDLERPRKRRRRNSDSNLYCKVRDEEIEKGKKEAEAKYLDSEKYAFVQSYLQNIETHSITETSDSGIRTRGEPSDFEMQDISDHSFKPCLKDLNKDVIHGLNVRLAGDPVARRHIYKSFGIIDPFPRSMTIFELFPDTPVKLFKDVLEALHLYDLVDLLPEKPQPVRSLRPALSLQEMEKLRKTNDHRPTTYHSNVAVLVITDEANSDTEGIERFFKGLSSKSDVTVFEWRILAYRDLLAYGFQRPSGRERRDEREMQRKLQEAQKETKNNEAAMSAVIERWIHNQGNFSLFAVFFLPTRYLFFDFGDSLMARLVSRIPDKMKFVLGTAIPKCVPQSPETLVISARARHFHRTVQRTMLDILNKRWQTLDLISMTEELKRSVCEEPNRSMFSPPIDFERVSITDRLSSRPRFEREEDITD